MRYPNGHSCSFLLAVVVGAAACGGADNVTVPPTTGTLEVTTATIGSAPDPDGYAVQVDAEPVQAIGSSATMQSTDIAAGNHTVQLTGMAANCTVTGENPRTVSITAGETMTVTFEVTCGPTTGGLQVTASTSGPSTDTDGYSIIVDGTDRGAIGASAGVSLDGLTAGDHEIGLSGVAVNCQVQGTNPQNVTITVGASATVAFTVTCAAPPASAGTLRITTATTGPDPDPNGYTLAVDGGATQPIGVNAMTSLANVAAGNHSVRISGLSRNCTVQGANPSSVSVSAGGTGDASFAVSCSATTGTIQVTVATSGSPADADGYLARLDGKDPGQPLAINGSTTFSSVPAGHHAVALTGVASNCSAAEGSSREVTVTTGASVQVAFTVTCAAESRIAFVSNGPGLLAIFLVNADGTGLTKLTDGSVPAWSPDKTRIAYFDNGVRVIGADGSGRTKLTEGLSQELQRRILPDPLQWSPDGTTIAFDVDASALGEGCCPIDIWLARADGGGTRKLVANGSSPSWSPDGRKIAFTSSRDGNDEIYVINSDGSGLKRLTNRPDVRDLSPHWSPDGTRMVFETQVIATSYDIAVMNADGTGLVNLSGGPSSDGSPVWLANGKIAFQTNLQIALMNSDGSGRTTLTNKEGMTGWVAWAPDGSQVAFVKNDPAGPLGVDPELYVMNADGTGLRNVSNRPDTSEQLPDW